MIEKTKIAYLLTPIDFGGAEKVSLNFLKAVDREKFSIVPIVFIRPWEKDNLFLRFLESEGYVYYKVPVAVKPVEEGRDFLESSDAGKLFIQYCALHLAISYIPMDILLTS